MVSQVQLLQQQQARLLRQQQQQVATPQNVNVITIEQSQAELRSDTLSRINNEISKLNIELSEIESQSRGASKSGLAALERRRDSVVDRLRGFSRASREVSNGRTISFEAANTLAREVATSKSRGRIRTAELQARAEDSGFNTVSSFLSFKKKEARKSPSVVPTQTEATLNQSLPPGFRDRTATEIASIPRQDLNRSQSPIINLRGTTNRPEFFNDRDLIPIAPKAVGAIGDIVFRETKSFLDERRAEDRSPQEIKIAEELRVTTRQNELINNEVVKLNRRIEFFNSQTQGRALTSAEIKRLEQLQRDATTVRNRIQTFAKRENVLSERLKLAENKRLSTLGLVAIDFVGRGTNSLLAGIAQSPFSNLALAGEFAADPVKQTRAVGEFGAKSALQVSFVSQESLNAILKPSGKKSRVFEGAPFPDEGVIGASKKTVPALAAFAGSPELAGQTIGNLAGLAIIQGVVSRLFRVKSLEVVDVKGATINFEISTSKIIRIEDSVLGEKRFQATVKITTFAVNKNGKRVGKATSFLETVAVVADDVKGANKILTDGLVTTLRGGGRRVSKDGNKITIKSDTATVRGDAKFTDQGVGDFIEGTSDTRIRELGVGRTREIKGQRPSARFAKIRDKQISDALSTIRAKATQPKSSTLNIKQDGLTFGFEGTERSFFASSFTESVPGGFTKQVNKLKRSLLKDVSNREPAFKKRTVVKKIPNTGVETSSLTSGIGFGKIFSRTPKTGGVKFLARNNGGVGNQAQKLIAQQKQEARVAAAISADAQAVVNKVGTDLLKKVKAPKGGRGPSAKITQTQKGLFAITGASSVRSRQTQRISQSQRSSQRANAATSNILKSSPRFSLTGKTVDTQKTSSDVRQSINQLVGQLQRSSQRTSQATAQITGVVGGLGTPSIFPPRTPNITKTIKPFRPIPRKKFKPLRRKTKRGAYDSFVAHVKVADNVTKSQALNIGSFIADNSTAARFRIKRDKGKIRLPRVSVPQNYFNFNKAKFRQGRITKGKFRFTKNKFIEQRNRRLDTGGETRQITAARLNKQLRSQAQTQRNVNEALFKILG